MFDIDLYRVWMYMNLNYIRCSDRIVFKIVFYLFLYGNVLSFPLWMY